MKKMFLLFLLLVPFAQSAFDTKVYSGWIDSRKNLTVNEEVYRFSWIRNENKTIVYLPDGSFMQISPEKNGCELEGFFSICQTGQKFFYRGKEVPPDITSDINASLYLYINKTDQGLNISKRFNATMYANFSTKVEIVISKLPGTREAITGIFLNDTYSQDFLITNMDGCRKSGNSVILEKPLFESKVTCAYDLTPLAPLQYKNALSLSYIVFERTRNRKVNYMLDVKDNPLLFSFSYNKTRKIGQKTLLNVSYSKKQGTSLESLMLSVPSGFEIEKTSGSIKKDGNSIYLENKSSTSFFILLNSTKENFGTIGVEYAFNVNNIKRTEFKKIDINYTAYIFDIEFLKKDNKSILRISNGPVTEYFNIGLFIGNSSFSIERLPRRSFREFEYINSSYFFVTYDTEYGQRVEKHIIKQAEKEYTNVTAETTKEKDRKKEDGGMFSDIKKASSLLIYFVLGAVLVFIVITILFKKSKKSNLDREIRELQKANFK